MKRFLLFIAFIPFFVHGQSTNNLNKLTNEEKIFGLSKIWKEVEYNFAYFDKVGREKWDSLYVCMIKSVQETKNDYEYFRELERFCAFLKDGHTEIMRFPRNIDRYTTVYKGFWIDFDLIENKVIVTRINTEKKEELPIGSELVEVNGLPTEKYLAQYVLPYISASTDEARRNNAAYYIFDGLKDMKYNVKIITPSKELKSIELVHGRIDDGKFPPELFPPKVSRNDIEFHWLENGIGYLAINTFNDSTVFKAFKEKLPDLYKAKKLIIDLRENGGGNTEIGLNIFEYLTNDTIIFGEKMRARKHISLNQANGARIKHVDDLSTQWEKESFLDFNNKLYTEFDYEPSKNKLKAKRIVIPTLILIGHKTISAAEDFLVFMKGQKHIKTLGERTSGSTGSPYYFDLPGGGRARICTLQSFNPDGSDFVGIGIIPDIEVKRTINGIINMKDEVLSYAINYFNELKIEEKK